MFYMYEDKKHLNKKISLLDHVRGHQWNIDLHMTHIQSQVIPISIIRSQELNTEQGPLVIEVEFCRGQD